MTASIYTCPMHPEIISDKPGACPKCGMALVSKNGIAAPDPTYKRLLIRFWLSLILTTPIVFLSMGPHFALLSEDISRWLQFALATPVVLGAGWLFFESAWTALRIRELNMFSLISLGVGTAYAYSVIALFMPQLFPEQLIGQHGVPIYFEAAAVITTLVLLGQVIETRAHQRTSFAIEALLERAAKTARVIRAEGEIEIPVDQVVIGDLIHILPGGKIPVDGTIAQGQSWIDESLMTGESMPVTKYVHDPVIAGTINQSGSFFMQAERIGSATVLAQIIEIVSTAQHSRAPIQHIADRVSAYFVPFVLLFALATFCIWFFFGPEPHLSFALVNAVAVLLIACPCALGLATPLSITVGIGQGALAGILIKHAEALERLESIDTLVVDKTGTLTQGKPKIIQIQSVSQIPENTFLQLAASVEQNSEHPLATTIVNEAKARSLTLLPAENFTAVVGQGAQAIVEGKHIFVGKQKVTESSQNKNFEWQTQLHNLEAAGNTVVGIWIDQEIAGLLAISDPIKSTTLEAIQALHQMKLKVVMVTGDNERTAQSIAEILNIDQIYAQISPKDKYEIVKQLQHDGHIIAMAGDGINDAPALAAADVGIAMGTGTDVALESAMITLVKGDLMGIVRAIELSRATMRNIRQNLVFAFIYNIASIPIAAGLLYPWTGLLLSPMLASLAMSLSSLSVVFNALRLKHITFSNK